MVILAVEPNLKELENLIQCLAILHPGNEILPYADPMLAVQYGVNHPVDVLYTAVDMKRLDGFALTKMLRKKYPEISVNLIATDDGYRSDAIRVMANSYLVKPVTAGRLRTAETAEDW